MTSGICVGPVVSVPAGPVEVAVGVMTGGGT
jgi:hypothetical protein